MVSFLCSCRRQVCQLVLLYEVQIQEIKKYKILNCKTFGQESHSSSCHCWCHEGISFEFSLLLNCDITLAGRSNALELQPDCTPENYSWKNHLKDCYQDTGGLFITSPTMGYMVFKTGNVYHLHFLLIQHIFNDCASYPPQLCNASAQLSLMLHGSPAGARTSPHLCLQSRTKHVLLINM